MNTSYEREIPRELIKGLHYYIINMFNSSYADYISNNRNKTIQYLQENNLEIIEINFERNSFGLSDYRLIVRNKNRIYEVVE